MVSTKSRSKKLAGWVARKTRVLSERADEYARKPTHEHCVVCLRDFFIPGSTSGSFSGPRWNPDHADTCDECAPGGGHFLPAGFR